MASDTYQFAAGFNNAVGLQDLIVQPTSPCPGVLYAQILDAVSGNQAFNSPYTEIRYTPRLPPSYYNSQNTQFGFNRATGVITVKGTFRIRINENAFANFNGIIKYPRNVTRVLAGWEGIMYKIVKLVAL